MIRTLVVSTLFVTFVSAALGQPPQLPGKSDADTTFDLPEVLQPAKTRSEAAEDKLTAATHYAQSRLLQQKGETLLALRHLQRAWRYDPETDFLLAEIVPLAFEAKQSEAAARYAVLAAERDPKDALLVRRLAIYLTDKQDYTRALRMYEKSLAKDDQLQAGVPTDLGAATVYAELGRLYFLTQQYQKSAAAFTAVRRALEEEKSSLDDSAKKSLIGEAAITYVLWGESFLEAGQHADAEKAFRKADLAKPNAPLLAFRLARVAAAQDKRDDAIKLLNEYFAAKTADSGRAPYELLAKLLGQQAANPAAAHEQLIARLRELHQEQPENHPLALSLANALWTTGKFDDAIPLLTATLAKQSDTDSSQKLIEHHWQQKEFRELLAAAGQLAERSGSLDSLGELLTRLQKDTAAVTACIKVAQEQAAQTDPKAKHAPILAAAIIARGGGKMEAAGQLFQAALALDPPNKTELRTQWALGLFLEDKNDLAAEMFRQVLAAEPAPGNPAAIRYYLAGALEMLGQTDAALQEIDKASQLQPTNPRYESRKAWILYHAKRWPAAAAEYEKFLDKHSAKQQAAMREQLRSAKLALSNIALEQGDFPAAVEWLEQVLDEYPEDPGALNDLGYLWADRGLHLQRALRMTQQAVALEPDNHAYRDSLGWAYFQLGQYEEAARELAVAVQEENPDGVLLEHYADALHKLGKTTAARSHWQRAAEAFQKAGETQKQNRVQEKLKASS
ncbi:photosystem I assembly protein Ycf3 [Anatilimnocola aggregata]|uniref:Photosystem I assembly protein Ycf3 n=1 Tax=Anatilimnocola aggregata TaxID=2528021 RepID=A0A517YLX7_9BACT|nr:tetratricopeptide repeat protein [Anatilimnocola aggregata]QDU31223.1 photosystem I assembly protein Ycf3 [Anatilimnocola aggregata]